MGITLERDLSELEIIFISLVPEQFWKKIYTVWKKLYLVYSR